MSDSPFTIHYECEKCDYLELWRSDKPGDYAEWLRKCAGCQRPLREGWLKVHQTKEEQNGMAQ